MAATPESKVKAKIHAALKAVDAYAVNYIGGQYANNGTPDILACLNGRFVGIEAKAGRGKPLRCRYAPSSRSTLPGASPLSSTRRTLTI